mmetsp:Transcript_30129/g.77719  ORF Transcript_30129/g.77719 Transcript_30129/m.77719 type:complete len:227 (-) Transcript_30129:6470-7150(-)
MHACGYEATERAPPSTSIRFHTSNEEVMGCFSTNEEVAGEDSSHREHSCTQSPRVDFPGSTPTTQTDIFAYWGLLFLPNLCLLFSKQTHKRNNRISVFEFGKEFPFHTGFRDHSMKTHRHRNHKMCDGINDCSDMVQSRLLSCTPKPPKGRSALDRAWLDPLFTLVLFSEPRNGKKAEETEEVHRPEKGSRPIFCFSFISFYLISITSIQERKWGTGLDSRERDKA